MKAVLLGFAAMFFAAAFGCRHEKWMVSPADKDHAQYGWETEYYLRTPTRVFSVSVGEGRVACNLTDIPAQRFYFGFVFKGQEGLGNRGNAWYLLHELLDQHASGLPPEVVRSLEKLWQSKQERQQYRQSRQGAGRTSCPFSLEDA